MPEKLQNRVKLHIGSVGDSNILERDNLPVESGGTIPMKQITDRWKKIFLEHRDFLINYGAMKINRNLYPKSVLMCDVDSHKTPLSEMDKIVSSNDVYESVHGSFRKLEID
jgi:hypothetical protein